MCTDGDAQSDAVPGQELLLGLTGKTDASIDPTSVERALSGTMFAGKLHYFANIDSTQARAIADAQANAAAGQVYVADEQTAGRGRGGHTWHSEPGSGLYMTVLARPALHAEQATGLCFAAGLATQAAIATVTGLRVDLRWPNDLVTTGPGSRKLGGILIESAVQADGLLRYAAIGIGLNLNQSAMPPEIETQSTSLRLVLGSTVLRQSMLIVLLRALEAELTGMEADPASVFERFVLGSTWAHGKAVRVAEDEGYTGVTEGLTDTGLLRVRCDSGSVRVVRHGGVRELLSAVAPDGG